MSISKQVHKIEKIILTYIINNMNCIRMETDQGDIKI